MKHKDSIQTILNRFLEGDAPDSEVNTLIRKVNAVQGGSKKDIADFDNYSKTRYGISNWSSFVNVVKSTLKGGALIGVGALIVDEVRADVVRAFYFIKKLPYFHASINNDKEFELEINGGPYRWLVMCIVSCFLIYGLYKIFMWLLKKPDKTVVESANCSLKLYRELELKKSLLENQVMFFKLNKVINDYRLIENDISGVVVNSVVEKAQPKCQSLLSRITTATSDFIQKYKKLIVITLICIGFVLGASRVVKILNNPDAKGAFSWFDNNVTVTDAGLSVNVGKNFF